MDPYVELLAQLGIHGEIEHPEPVRQNSPILPDRPHHYDDDGTAVFTSAQLEWCRPEELGFSEPYHVIETMDTDSHYQHAYQEPVPRRPGKGVYTCSKSQEIGARKRKRHLYCRRERFLFVLGELVGSSGPVPPKVLDLVADELDGRKINLARVWNMTRAALKRHGLRIYYNRIPQILRRLDIHHGVVVDQSFIKVVRDFEKMHWAFQRDKCGRAYFPNLRYIALRLLGKHGITFPYRVPMARTKRKVVSLDLLYDKLWNLTTHSAP